MSISSEKLTLKESTAVYADSVSVSENSVTHPTLINRMKDSFRRADMPMITEEEISDLDNVESQDRLGGYTADEKIQLRLATQPLKKKLKQRHQTMLAIGGTLGTGLFIGLGYSLASGPGSLLIGFLLVGTSMFCVVQSAAELSCQFPVSGSYATHVSRFIDKSIGFTVSTNYALSWLISFPSELIGLSMTISYWNSSVNPCVWIAIFYVFVMVLNLCSVEAFAETEFFLSIIKVIAIIIFIIIGIVLVCGGGPNSDGYIGTHYWHDPGSFAHPVFKSLCNTFVSAAFSFGGSELVLLTAAESKDVGAISRAAKGTFWRIAIFYITTVVVIGCLVPYNDERLLGGSSSEDVTASPFVIALSNAGSMGTKVSNFMNVIILIAVVSVANSCVYASSRVIQALGASGQLPSICGYIDKKGRPLVGIGICGIFGLLGFLVASDNEGTVFTWLFALCSISSFFTWFCICFSQVRYRLALKRQGRSTDEIAYKSMLGLAGGILGSILNILLIAGEIYVSASPVGAPSTAEAFFENCLSIPIMIVVYIGHKFYTKDWSTWYIATEDIDLDTGCSFDDVEAFKKQRLDEKARIASRSWLYRTYRFWC
ncbi:similar to Saccharomyces cerevisiae YPL274W SAM3 High-affinity S-adenosylmethionine permease, required for utilization of S-adenosylmethionine as a sulfur source [Maudiozyma saulgeensis]|uniref:Similar to Saccharomyces cerevisiae YPL274W SAM3 High-affinity S-adenosylmethionine permease, required for utilization of S-adenosylmethionine as a sulfur source n=1 Tax=Maudiozyma saulgeensis TaxID=1789683 RepID=A0A1X7QWX0_9SACH|nr:similar to Saccharomyces cerevisiae YPL274W SAM3 High-affinity S-adenosylmethionine permease, required for utilization of S-adenosylmethionine as a sulfur source [Kazachstania saulgeensis]